MTRLPSYFLLKTNRASVFRSPFLLHLFASPRTLPCQNRCPAIARATAKMLAFIFPKLLRFFNSSTPLIKNNRWHCHRHVLRGGFTSTMLTVLNGFFGFPPPHTKTDGPSSARARTTALRHVPVFTHLPPRPPPSKQTAPLSARAQTTARSGCGMPSTVTRSRC